MSITDNLDIDIALEIVNTMLVDSLHAIDECNDADELERLNKKAGMYASELKAITGTDDEFRASVIDKAFEYYAQIIRRKKANNEKVSSFLP